MFNIGLIGYFKYRDFFVGNINSLFAATFTIKNILLPLGISFFTFQQLSFLISIYKGEENIGKFVDYCLFVTFFPQLVAGPIVTYKEMIPQFADKNRRFYDSANFSIGIYMFSIGLFKKAVIADSLAVLVDNGFGMENIGFVAGWVTSLSYTFQIYFDFSGYSDMAIGLGKIFNIEIPFNFDEPYKSKSITEFWRRWHITLGRALSTYIYIPLGGSRKGLARTCMNLFITFLVSGLWHGAAWTFVVWGILHGLFMIIERVVHNKCIKLFKLIPRFLKILFTFLIVNALWVLFRADSFLQAVKIYKGMTNLSNIEISQIDEVVGHVAYMTIPLVIDIAYVIGFMIFCFLIVFRFKSSTKLYSNFGTSSKSPVSAAVMFCIALLCLSRGSAFIYFNF